MPKFNTERRRNVWLERAAQALMNQTNSTEEKEKHYFKGIAETCIIALSELGVKFENRAEPVCGGLFKGDKQ